MRSRLTAILLLAAVATGCRAQELTIVTNGRSDYQIVLGEGPNQVARMAADELQRWLAEATGVTLPIAAEADPALKQIFVGQAALPADAGVDVAALPPEGFVVRTVGEDLVLVGVDDGIHPEEIASTAKPTQTGTMNAVYDFLEDYVGVHWYWHDDLGTIVPELEALTIPALDDTEAPRFIYRALPYGPTVDGAQVASREWGRRNRLGKSISTYHSHAFFRHLPIDRYAAEHPEYYALVGDRRVTRYYSGSHGGQVCTTNPEVISIFAQSCLDYFRATPERTMCAVSPNDGGGFCECDECTALDPGPWPEGRGRDGVPLMADRMLTFYNQIAEQTSAEFPDHYLGAYVYSYYSLPPERVKPHPNLALVLAINSAWRGGSEEFWAQDREMIDGWAAIHDYMFMYDIFYTSHTAGFPAPIIEHTKSYMHHIDDLGYRGGYLYIAPTWESLGPGAYLMAKLLWDPQADSDAIVARYYADLYGEAADEIRAYDELIEQRWVAAVAGDLDEASPEAQFFTERGGASTMRGTLLTVWQPILSEARGMLETALAATDDDDGRARVQRVMDQFEFAEASTQALEGIARFEASRDPDPAVTSAVREAIERREAIIERIGSTWSPHFRDWVRSNDESDQSPLRPSAAYFTLAGEASRVSLTAPRAATAPVIDGVADDAAWQGAPRGTMRENKSAADATAPTQVAVTFDAETVYVLIEATEPEMGKLAIERLGHDNNELFRSDNVELILDPGGEGTNYAQFAINVGGSTWDGLHADAQTTDIQWSPQWQSAVELGEAGWSVEMAVPLEALGVDAIAEGDSWRFNVHRTRRASQPNEYQALSPTLGGYHLPNMFGILNFGNPPTGENVLERWDAERFEVGALGEDVLRGGGNGGYSIEIANDRVYSGEKAIKLTVGEDSLATITWYPASVEPGSYRLAMRYHADPLGPADPERPADVPITRVIFRDEAGEAVSESREYSWQRSSAEAADGAWADHIHVFRTLPGTKRFSITVFIHRPGTYWIDDVSLVRF
jgi:hypothetical protein